MSIKNNRIFGLAVPLSLADIPDNELALKNLGLDIRDLDVIRGIAAAGFDGNDLQTLSNLDTPIWRTFDRYINDVLTYNNALSRSAGADFRARGNIEVLGPISSSAFRYTLLDTFASPPVLRWGDISTSRVSSWSSIGNSISYGADVKIAGRLTVGKLKTRAVPTPRTFLSEVPTHKIKLRLNGIDRYFLVMKGIPIRFKGFFRDFSCRIDFQTSSVKNSWRVYNTDGTSVQDFADIGSNTSSTLNYNSPFSSEKFIEIYTNPAVITYLALNNCSIQEIPKSRLTALETFSFSTNGLVDFPNLNFFSPALKTLDITNNPFFNGSDPDERYFSKKIASKLPSTLQSINISGCFKGGFVQNQLNKFTSLNSINASRSSFNTTAFFYPDSKNPSGELPNFYGIFGNDTTQTVTSINFYNNDFRVITNGVQGGVESTSLSPSDGGSGGTGYAGGASATYNNVPLTGGSGSNATANIGVENGVVIFVEIVNPGSGYVVGNNLSASNTNLGGTGGGLLINVKTIINVLSVKQQNKLVGLELGANPLLTDSGFSLSASGTLTTVGTYDTRLSIANCSNFPVLDTYNNTYGSGRGSLWTGWNGVFGSAGYPQTDLTNFKFANCPKLRYQYNNYSDVTGYLPKYVGCPELRAYDFYSCNNIIAGRPGKRPIERLFSPGGISQLGGFTTGPGTGAYRFNLNKAEFNDTGANSAGATQLARVAVTTDAAGNVTAYSIVNPGSGYTTSMKVTISATQLGSSSPGRNLIIDITTVDSGFVRGVSGTATYTPGTYLLTDNRTNTAVGRNARVQVVIGSSGIPTSYSLDFAGQDYQNNEFVTLNASELGNVGGSTNDLRIKIARAQPPKILYNDQFTENLKITSVDIVVDNVNFRGEIESGAFTPIRDTLSFLRLYTNGRIDSGFPNLDDATAIRTIYSNDQGWSGTIPRFTQAFNLTDLYLQNNKFQGTFDYVNKPILDYVNYSNNLLTSISNASRLPVCRYFYFSNNLLSGRLPELDVISPNVEYVQLNNNNYTNYTLGLISLPKLKSIDLSNNGLPTPIVDRILFDLVKNYQAANRGSVLVNLQGGRMGAPTPYPITTGIISSITIPSQPVFTNGNITSLGSLAGFSANSIPVNGTYNGLGLSGGTGVPGSGASANVTVNIASLDKVVTAINTTPIISGTITIGKINAIGTYTGGGSGSIVPGTYDLFDNGLNSGGNTSAQVRITVANVAGTNQITGISLLNGGSGYTRQGTSDRITISSGGAANFTSAIVINLTTVTEFTNTTNTVFTDTKANTLAGQNAKVRLTIVDGAITTATLDTLPSGGGTGYVSGEDITLSVPGTGDLNVANNVRFDITGVQQKWYSHGINSTTSISAVINNGGSGYTQNSALRTSNGITFRRTNGNNETGFLNVTVGSVTQQTNRAVFTGFGAVEYLRQRGWTVQVQS